MTAVRSAMARLSLRSGVFSGSSAAAPTGGRVIRPAAPRTPPLRHSAVGNVEGWRRYSTEGREPTVRMWWQRYRDHMRNLDEEERVRYVTLYALVVLGGPMIYRMKT
ncbi:unnamed protein product [Urochloa decumbens]|uniref:Uncharacterized protein n=1 Tax=Urochloa decumbens TaxID=240449 RepID=A0ABC8ZDV5_9POAL